MSYFSARHIIKEDLILCKTEIKEDEILLELLQGSQSITVNFNYVDEVINTLIELKKVMPKEEVIKLKQIK